MKLPQSHCKIIYNGFILNDIDNACENVRKILKSIEATVDLNSDQYFDIRIILSELLQNAIKHGNERGKKNKVFLNVYIMNENVLNITIKDQGSGFNASKILQDELNRKVCDVQELTECGRGLCIIKNLCDRMDFNRRGNRITVLKKLI